MPYPIPPLGYEPGSRHNLSDTVPAFIVQGETHRADVLRHIGEPDISTGDDTFYYLTAYRMGGIGTALLVYGSSDTPMGNLERTAYRRLTVDFDGQGVVSSARVELRSCWRTSVNGMAASMLGDPWKVSANCLTPGTDAKPAAADVLRPQANSTAIAAHAEQPQGEPAAIVEVGAEPYAIGHVDWYDDVGSLDELQAAGAVGRQVRYGTVEISGTDLAFTPQPGSVPADTLRIPLDSIATVRTDRNGVAALVVIVQRSGARAAFLVLGHAAAERRETEAAGATLAAVVERARPAAGPATRQSGDGPR